MLLFFCCYGVLLYALNQNKGTPTAASKLIFQPAKVVEIESSNLSEDTWTEGRRIGQQVITVEILRGKHKGLKLETVNYVNAYTNVDVSVGTRLIVNLDKDSNGDTYISYISSYDRLYQILFLVIVFVGLLILIGGKKGVSALGGLVFTVISIWYLLIPLVQKGISSIIATILLVTVTTFVSLILLNGFSVKTVCASLGCIFGVMTAGIISAIAARISPINGYNMAEAESLVLVAKDGGLKISGLLVSGILIASLGAIMDVAMTITSSIFELHTVNTELKTKELFKSGMNIGKDAMGTMANTLILAFAGASLNMLILFRVYNYPFLQIINSDMMILEIINGLAGSIGIILTVPIVTFISSYFCKKTYGRNKKENEKVV